MKPKSLVIASTAASKLAIDGGNPIRTKTLPYSRQNISEEDIKMVEQALRSDIITRGPFVEKFEKAVAEMVEMPYAVAYCNATAALHGVMALVGADKGRVITSPITFAATSNAVLYCGGRPEFQDVDSKTMNLDPHALQNLKDVAAVTPVDFSGNPCEFEAFQKLQNKFKFRLISDAAHSIGATYKKKSVGSFADITIFSFHPVKSLTTGEGGMVVCKNKDEAEFLRRFRSHGIVRTDQPGFYKQEFLGFNYNITDIHCALGLSQLARLSKFVARREEIAQQYNEFFANHDCFDIPVLTKDAKSSWHLYPLRLKLDRLKVNRDEFLTALHAEGIGANVHYIPVYWHPHYERIGFKRGLCPKAEVEYLREISIPVFPGMTDEDVKDVCRAIDKLAQAYSRP